MTKSKYGLILILSLVFAFSTANAQLFKIGVGGGLTQVTAPDQFTRDVENNGLGYSTEYNFGAMAKLDLPIVPLTPRAFVLYHKLNGEGTPPLEGLAKGNTVGDNVKFSQSILSIGAGVQYSFIPAPLGFDPYIALDLAYNNFGDFTIDQDGNETTITGSDSRFGIAFGLGTEVTIVPVVNIDLFVSYNLFNLIGKDDGEDTISSVNLDAFITFSFL